MTLDWPGAPMIIRPFSTVNIAYSFVGATPLTS